MLIEGISWVDQEVVLYNPVYTGTYKGMPVIEVGNPFIPIREKEQIDGDVGQQLAFLRQDDPVAVNPFTYESGKFGDKELKTYRLVFVKFLKI